MKVTLRIISLEVKMDTAKINEIPDACVNWKRVVTRSRWSSTSWSTVTRDSSTLQTQLELSSEGFLSKGFLKPAETACIHPLWRKPEVTFNWVKMALIWTMVNVFYRKLVPTYILFHTTISKSFKATWKQRKNSGGKGKMNQDKQLLFWEPSTKQMYFFVSATILHCHYYVMYCFDNEIKTLSRVEHTLFDFNVVMQNVLICSHLSQYYSRVLHDAWFQMYFMSVYFRTWIEGLLHGLVYLVPSRCALLIQLSSHHLCMVVADQLSWDPTR